MVISEICYPSSGKEDLYAASFYLQKRILDGVCESDNSLDLFILYDFWKPVQSRELVGFYSI